MDAVRKVLHIDWNSMAAERERERKLLVMTKVFVIFPGIVPAFSLLFS